MLVKSQINFIDIDKMISEEKNIENKMTTEALTDD
jgi:hypothetical protein